MEEPGDGGAIFRSLPRRARLAKGELQKRRARAAARFDHPFAWCGLDSGGE